MKQFLISTGLIVLCLVWALSLVGIFMLLVKTLGWGVVLLGVAAVAIAGVIAICVNEYRLSHRREVKP